MEMGLLSASPRGPKHATTRPANYVVLHDEIFRAKYKVSPGQSYPPGHGPADKLQQFIHNFCYLYGRYTKAFSLCPPLYYANLLAERGARILKKFYSSDRTNVQPQQYAVPKPPREQDLQSVILSRRDKKEHDEEQMGRYLAEIVKELRIHNVKDITFYV